MDSAARQVMVAGDVVATTRREYELLELFLRHPAQVLSKEQIHDAVWGDAQTVNRASSKSMRARSAASCRPLALR